MAASNDPRRFDFVYNDVGYQAPVILDGLAGLKSIQLAPVVAGSGKVQATISPLSAVNGGTADWVDWPAGTVSGVTQDTVEGITAIRVYHASGTTRLCLRVE